MRILAVIPARLLSSRLPKKVLLPLQGKPLFWWVYQSAKKVSTIEKVLLAADDEEILQEAKKLHIPSLLTSKEHPSGTHRLIEVYKKMPSYDIYLNLQADEPFITPLVIEKTLSLLKNPLCDIATSCRRISSWEEYQDPSVVKVVFREDKRALYFSRSPIPYISKKPSSLDGLPLYHHIGIYAYRASSLEKIEKASISLLSKLENLEQLTFLSIGLRIYIEEVSYQGFGIDTWEDYEKAKKLAPILLKEGLPQKLPHTEKHHKPS